MDLQHPSGPSNPSLVAALVAAGLPVHQAPMEHLAVVVLAGTPELAVAAAAQVVQVASRAPPVLLVPSPAAVMDQQEHRAVLAQLRHLDLSLLDREALA
ncbi:hypothetical protein [Delftia acidovorans]